jgi:hypothetical protein
VRLARSLLKVTIVLVLAGGALGGAAALGSTLFEQPPRDAAEFARRVEAASKRAADQKRTGAERRYARRLNALCLRRRAADDDLAMPRSAAEIPAWYRRARPVFLRRAAQIAALHPPRSYRAQVEELLALDRQAIAAFDRLVERLRSGDRAALEEMRLGIERLADRAENRLVALGGLGCVRG